MAIFSKRHYEAIAQAIRKEIELQQQECDKLRINDPDVEDKASQDRDACYCAGALDMSANIRQALAELFKSDNPAFNADRFLKASSN